MQTQFVELSTGEMFLYDQTAENVDFLAMQKIIEIEPKHTYKIMSQLNPKTGDVAYGFLRMDNDVFPAQGRIRISSDKVVMTYALEPNSDVSKGFENAKTQESAKRAGLQLVK
jgi:hypothetical protein